MTILTLTEMILVGILILTNELDEIDVIGVDPKLSSGNVVGAIAAWGKLAYMLYQDPAVVIVM